MAKIFTKSYGKKFTKSLGDYFKENKNAYGPRWEAYKKCHPLKFEHCRNCNSRKDLQRHHKISPVKWPDGVDKRHNIVVLCRTCHNMEHGRKF